MDDVSNLLMGQAQRDAQTLLTVLADAAAQAQQQGGDPYDQFLNKAEEGPDHA